MGEHAQCIHCGKVRGQGAHHYFGPAGYCQKGPMVGSRHEWQRPPLPDPERKDDADQSQGGAR